MNVHSDNRETQSTSKPAVTFATPDHVRGIYLTAWTAGSTKALDKILTNVKGTIINSVVIDIRDAGTMFVKTGLPLATESHSDKIAIRDLPGLLTKLKAAGIYPIARIACFRDQFVPVVHPDRAVENANGSPWKDRGGYRWLDPYNKKNWDYVFQVANFAIQSGFPEVQMDYIRFPSEGKKTGQVFPSERDWPAGTAQSDVIASFAQWMNGKVHDDGAKISADVFGIISSGTSDQGIGQQLQKIGQWFDALSPMVYPSHFSLGEYGIKYPNSDPYGIVRKSLADYRKKTPNLTLRPWLQDFDLNLPNRPKVHYGTEQIQAQFQAAKDEGVGDFLLWNARNHYTYEAFKNYGSGTTTQPKQPPK